MGKKVYPQGASQSRQPKPLSRKRLTALCVLTLVLAVGIVRFFAGGRARQEITLDLGSNVKMRLVLIPAGKFVMGSPASESGAGENADYNDRHRYDNERPQHEVAISRPFFMGVYEVTQEQYEAVMGKDPSQSRWPTNPVENVSWYDAAEFCKRLSARTGRAVTLPTEAQWEYACRAGTTTPFNTGDILRLDQAYISSESRPGPGAWRRFADWMRKLFRMKVRAQSYGQPVPVGGFPPNDFGLFDMHGNVLEWCADWYGADYYAKSTKTDPPGPAHGRDRTMRGGWWFDDPKDCRSAIRGFNGPGYSSYCFGFRVAVAAE